MWKKNFVHYWYVSTWDGPVEVGSMSALCSCGFCISAEDWVLCCLALCILQYCISQMNLEVERHSIHTNKRMCKASFCFAWNVDECITTTLNYFSRRRDNCRIWNAASKRRGNVLWNVAEEFRGGSCVSCLSKDSNGNWECVYLWIMYYMPLMLY